jgi:hypothetical protein
VRKAEKEPAETAEELHERAELVKKKLEQRKATKKSSNALTKVDRKRIKREKLQKAQKMQSLKKVVTSGMMKQHQDAKDRKIKQNPDELVPSKVFNKEGKLFFSKMKLDGENKKLKRGHNTDPKANLLKLKSQKKKIKDLIESGDTSTAKDEKHKMLWQSAFEKTEGVKVKDNEEILKKTIKKRKTIKKKSKEQWIDRKKKLDEKQATQLKKRDDNINKRKTDKQKTKVKRAMKKGSAF